MTKGGLVIQDALARGFLKQKNAQDKASWIWENASHPTVQAFRNSLEKRGFAFILPLGLLMLAMAVFVWGLQYKLSLYKNKDSIAHSAPAAKLLSEKERPVTAQVVDAPLPQPPPFPIVPALLMLAMAPAFDLAVHHFRMTRERVPAPLPYRLRTVFYRPPPTR